jgi:CYTH domain-containing protein
LGVEIERKFLVKSDDWRQGASGTAYRQGYLCREPGRTVRVRMADGRGFLTVKGPTVGASRPEFEYTVPAEDAAQLLALCEGPLVEKTRYRIPFGGFVWELDEFLGDNRGLVVAEIEIPTEDTAFPLPPWAGSEVTDDPRYANSQLSVHPFSRW